MRHVLTSVLVAVTLLSPLGCGAVGVSVSGHMTRERTVLVRTGPEAAAGPLGEWNLNATNTMGAVSLSAGSTARLWAGWGQVAYAITNTEPFPHGGAHYACRAWLAGCEVGREPVSPPGVFVRLRALHLEVPERSGEFDDPDSHYDTWSNSLSTSSVGLLAGWSARAGRAYCGVRVSSVRSSFRRDAYTYDFEEDSNVGFVVGVEGACGKSSVFVEATFLDSTGVTAGMTWSM